jgi:hypothetical protein
MHLGAKTFSTLHIGSGIHPATYTIFTGSFVEGKPARTWRKTLPTSNTVVKERVQLYLYIPLVLHIYSRMPFTFYTTCKTVSCVPIKPSDVIIWRLKVTPIPGDMLLLSTPVGGVTNWKRGTSSRLEERALHPTNVEIRFVAGSEDERECDLNGCGSLRRRCERVREGSARYRREIGK